MILVTVGTQIPFDRLIKSVDDLAAELNLKVFAQIGRSQYVPAHLEFAASMRPEEFEDRFKQAEVIIAHAGIGTILGALRHRKPIIIYPRRASFGEHRNDHQLATCEQLRGRHGIYVAYDDLALKRLLTEELLSPPDEAAVAQQRKLFTANLSHHIRQLVSS